ncbi:unnamed protein product, partial [Amoebophrya sp. A25]
TICCVDVQKALANRIGQRWQFVGILSPHRSQHGEDWSQHDQEDVALRSQNLEGTEIHVEDEQCEEGTSRNTISNNILLLIWRRVRSYIHPKMTMAESSKKTHLEDTHTLLIWITLFSARKAKRSKKNLRSAGRLAGIADITIYDRIMSLSG